MSDTHLDDIGVATGTDQSSLFHAYTFYFHELLSPIRHKWVNVLEIGVLGGNSLCMWDAFFDHPRTNIVGIDIHERWKPDEGSRCKFRLGSQDDPAFIASLVHEFGMFDIVLDDGSHFSRHQKISLDILWPYVNPGGIYCVSDVHTSYTYPWTDAGERSFVESTMDWIHRLNENGKDHCGKPTETDIDEIVFRKSLVILKKR